MNAFEKLLALPAAGKKRRGVVYTPPEIAQQPAVWAQTALRLARQAPRIRAFLQDAGWSGRGDTTVVLTGAGTSEFVGNAIAGALQSRLRRPVRPIPTTHLVTHLATSLVPGRPGTLVSFARSGNSPESLATYRLARRLAPQVRHVVITCNADGALARAAHADGDALCLVLPEEANDRALAMTSSFSAMALAGIGLAFLAAPAGRGAETGHDALRRLAARLGDAAQRVLHAHGDALAAFAARRFTRACYLGSGTLFGTMQECHLKMQELTNGRVACRFDSFLGLRHGPQVFVDRTCVVIAALASDPSVRRYELDLLHELRAKRQGVGTLVVADRATPEVAALADVVVDLFPDAPPVADDYRVLTDVVVGQVLGVFKSLDLGLKPDSPSPGGTIHRVVQGVTIYDLPAAGARA